jgi:hypothetical protein
VGNNELSAIYKFNSTGVQVDATGNPTGTPVRAPAELIIKFQPHPDEL